MVYERQVRHVHPLGTLFHSACGEWVMSEREMTVEEYEKYFDLFDPVDYNPREWVRLAKEAGMKYAVLTAKHHEGFCLFDSS